MTPEEHEFLVESNAIEREYSDTALRDAKQAWMMACLASDEDISIDYILGIHRRLMKRLNPRISGSLRKVRVGIMSKGRFKEAISWKKVKGELTKLCKLKVLNWQDVKKWHIQFEHIHPFEDGNGRTGRIIMNVQRVKLGLPILVIHEGKEQQNYYKWFRKNDGEKTNA